MTGNGPNPIEWRRTREAIARDHERLCRMLEGQWGCRGASPWLHPGGLCVALFRIAHHLWQRDHRKCARLVSQVSSVLTGGDIHPASRIGPGLAIPHPTGVAILCGAGGDLTVLSRSGTGMLPKARDVGAGMGVPLLGDRCILGPCNGVEGPQRVGDDVVLVTGVALTEAAASSARLGAARPAAPGPAPARHTPRSQRRECRHRSFTTTWHDFVADLDAYLAQGRGRTGPQSAKALLSALLTTQLLSLAIYRASHLAYARGWRGAAFVLAAINRWGGRLTINPGSCVGGGWFLPHPAGVVVNADAGPGLVMFAYAVAASEGNALRDSPKEGPLLGDGAVLAAHSGVLGPITLGDNVRLGFGTHVRDDVPPDRLVVSPGCRAAAAPAPIEGGAGHHCEEIPDGVGERKAQAADWARLVAFEQARGFGALLALRLSPAWVCVRLYRASRRALVRGRARRARRLWQINMFLTGADLRPWSRIGPGLLIPYPACVSLNGHAGRNLTVLAMAGVDPAPEHAMLASRPVDLAFLGDDVALGFHAGVVGGVTVGDRVTFEAGARVTTGVAADCTCLAAGLRMQRRARRAGPLSMDALQRQSEDAVQAGT